MLGWTKVDGSSNWYIGYFHDFYVHCKGHDTHMIEAIILQVFLKPSSRNQMAWDDHPWVLKWYSVQPK